MTQFSCDELANGQAVMHYSRHRLTTSLITWLRVIRFKQKN